MPRADRAAQFVVPFEPSAGNVQSVHALTQPHVLRASGLAALLSSLACYPRLALWLDRPDHTGLLWVILLWAFFFLWGFVFAWHAKYAGQKVFIFQIPRWWWLAATLAGGAVAGALRLWIDPALRRFTPADYPASLSVWGSMALFGIAFDQLVLCFAPFALFSRLFQNRKIAILSTVLLGVFIMALKVNASEVHPPASLLAGLLAARILIGFLSVRFYLAGGAILAWWWRLLLETRHGADWW